MPQDTRTHNDEPNPLCGCERDENCSAALTNEPFGIGLIEAIEQRYPANVLETLLKDKTTERNIIWADSEYEALGCGYHSDDEITVERITGKNAGIIKPRIAKAQQRQSIRTRTRAEVFTPSWLCNQMNNHFDEEWFGRNNVFNVEGEHDWEPQPAPIELPKAKERGWKNYVSCPRLEITCGEAPFICSRYDAVTGYPLPVERRIGFLDRKLRLAAENTATYKTWVKWALEALKSTYGYEYQGDNLVIARINVLESFVEHTNLRWGKSPSLEEVLSAADIISWNLWQMDGLSGKVPLDQPIFIDQSALFGLEHIMPIVTQPTLFDLFDEGEEKKEPEKTIPFCIIYDWEENKPKTYVSLRDQRTCQ